MPVLLDLTGQRFGELVVNGRAKHPEKGDIGWDVTCSCGQNVAVSSSLLTSGHTSSCPNCTEYKPTSYHDLRGVTIYGTTIQVTSCLNRRGKEKDRKWLVRCLVCNCIDTRTETNLLGPYCSSCRAGCRAKKMSPVGTPKRSRFEDLTGQLFGALFVLKPYGKRYRACPEHYICLCRCGKRVIINQALLSLGRHTSCGCLAGSNAHNLVGLNRFWLLVEKRVRGCSVRGTRWRCRCRCGNRIDLYWDDILSGSYRHCGYCYQNKLADLPDGLVQLERRLLLRSAWSGDYLTRKERSSLYHRQAVNVRRRLLGLGKELADAIDDLPALEVPKINRILSDRTHEAAIRLSTALESLATLEKVLAHSSRKVIKTGEGSKVTVTKGRLKPQELAWVRHSMAREKAVAARERALIAESGFRV